MNISHIYPEHFTVGVHGTIKAIKIPCNINTVADRLPCSKIAKTCNRYSAGRVHGYFKRLNMLIIVF